MAPRLEEGGDAITKAPRWPPAPPRRHHHRPLVRRPLRTADRRAAGGHGVLRQVGRRQSDQHRHRRRAARPEGRRSSPASATSSMGRFIREQLAREGVAVDGVVTDPKRLTALVVLGVRDERTAAAHLLPRRLRRHGAVRGRHRRGLHRLGRRRRSSAARISRRRPSRRPATRRSATAKAAGRKVVFDVDYRPNLWGLAGHGAGDNRYIRSDAVTRRLDAVVSQVDLIVGTEEELMIAGGGETTARVGAAASAR